MTRRPAARLRVSSVDDGRDTAYRVALARGLDLEVPVERALGALGAVGARPVMSEDARDHLRIAARAWRVAAAWFDATADRLDRRASRAR